MGQCTLSGMVSISWKGHKTPPPVSMQLSSSTHTHRVSHKLFIIGQVFLWHKLTLPIREKGACTDHSGIPKKGIRALLLFATVESPSLKIFKKLVDVALRDVSQRAQL